MRLRTVLSLGWLVLALGLLAGCGSDSDSGEAQKASDSGGQQLVDWPTFGRVPERTQYLPTDKRELDPPLREDWSINTHGLIEFPAGRRRRRRLRRQQVRKPARGRAR